MLRESFTRVYSKFKLHFYQKVFERWQDREASLTTVETFCMEIINAAGEPTVNEFARLANLSSPNAAYKVNNLVKKGYLKKGTVQGGQAGISSAGYPKIFGLLQHQLSIYGYRS